MKEDRINQLLSFIDKEPDDPFNYYALALEYLNSDRLKALEYFKKLRVDHKDYLPTYYHLAQLYVDLGDGELAQQVFRDGIQLAEAKADLHTLRELKNAYNNFLFEED